MATQYAKKLKDGARQYRVEPLLPNKPRGFRDNPIRKSMGTLGGFDKEISVSKVQVDALRTLYYAQPAIQSCRSVLVGELLGSGFELVRNGKRVDLTAEFRAHLQEHWVPFAQAAIDCFLVAGFCVVDYEKVDIDVGGKRKKNGAVVPICAPLDTYQLHYHYRESKYRRTYMVYPTNNMGNTEPDEEVDVHIRTAPDAHGNCVSPVATCYDLGSTQMALVELALKAESLRTKAMIISQPAPTKAQDDPLGSASMFFDSESRAIQAGLEQDSNASAANALSLQVQLCQVINRLQNRGEEAERADHRAHKLGMDNTSFVPPTQKPELCSLPKVSACSNCIERNIPTPCQRPVFFSNLVAQASICPCHRSRWAPPRATCKRRRAATWWPSRSTPSAASAARWACPRGSSSRAALWATRAATCGFSTLP